MNPEDRGEDLLQEYLKGDSALSRLYRSGAHEQPDAQLDARILAQARRAVAQTRRAAHSPFARHWMVPASLAAVLVLSVSVVLLTPEPGLEPSLEGGPEDDGVAGAPAPAGSTSAAPDAAPGGEILPAPASAPAHAPLAAERATRRERASGAEDGAAGGRASGLQTLQSPAREKGVDEPAGVSSEKREGMAAQSKSVTSGEQQLRPAMPASASVAEEAAAPSVSRPLLEPLPGTHPMPADSVQADPAAWLRFIEALLDERNTEAAKSNLHAFRERYPDFPLPAALMPLAAPLDTQRP